MSARFEGPDGEVNPLAARLHDELVSAAFYLARWRTLGHQDAADATCRRYGHTRARAGRCDLCGRGVTAEEVRASRGGR